MKVKVKCFPPLDDGDSCNFQDATSFEINPGDKVSDLIDRLDFPEEKVSRVFINGHKVITAAHLSDGDRVGFFPSLKAARTEVS